MQRFATLPRWIRSAGGVYGRQTWSRPPAPSHGRRPDASWLRGGGLATAAAVAAWSFSSSQFVATAEPRTFAFDEVDIENWSGTHTVHCSAVCHPETTEEVVAIVEEANQRRRTIRPVGSALSPNGLGMDANGMMSMALCDKIVSVDKDKAQVTVQAGARVSQVVDALRPYGLTLQNYASIAEQQIGGFIQVGAHGTGATIPPVEEQVVSMKLVTPKRGLITLSESQEPELFRLAKVGLGALGVVAEVTLQCVPMHKLKETTFVTTRKEVRKNHAQLLANNRHLRYMWIPYTDAVVVVLSNPCSDDEEVGATATPESATRPARDLLRRLSPQSRDTIDNLSFTQLRDRLLALDPLNVEHVKRVNEAEAKFWKASGGTRVDFSDRILGFDCGGQQWVSEVAFPIGARARPTLRDIDFMEELLHVIEDGKGRVAAPAPLEQRWTARSSSPMSIAYSESPEMVFCWVGIIMYLPTEEEVDSSHPYKGGLPQLRSDITSAFNDYRGLWRSTVWAKYWGAEHWAKIEPAADDTQLQAQRAYLSQRIEGLAQLSAAAQTLDPHGILRNDLLRRLGLVE